MLFVAEFRHLSIPASKSHVPMQHFSNSKSLDCISSAELPTVPNVNSILQQASSHCQLSDVSSRAGTLVSNALSIFLSSILEKAVNSARVRRSSEEEQ